MSTQKITCRLGELTAPTGKQFRFFEVENSEQIWTPVVDIVSVVGVNKDTYQDPLSLFGAAFERYFNNMTIVAEFKCMRIPFRLLKADKATSLLVEYAVNLSNSQKRVKQHDARFANTVALIDWLDTTVYPALYDTPIPHDEIPEYEDYAARQAIAKQKKREHDLRRWQLKRVQKPAQVHETPTIFDELKPSWTDSDAIPITFIAKEFGMSARELNLLLGRLKIQYKLDGVWVLYQKYAHCGYTAIVTRVVNGRAFNYRFWTQAGRTFLHKVLRLNGYRPIAQVSQPSLF